MFRKVIVTRRGHLGDPRRKQSARRSTRGLASCGVRPTPPTTCRGAVPSVLRPTQIAALLVGILALLFIFAGEIAAPGMLELAFAAMLLGCGLASARLVGCGLAAGRHRIWAGPAGEADPHGPIRLDPTEQIERHVRLLQRRRRRCLDTMSEIERCAAAEREAGRLTDRLDDAAATLAAAIAAFDAGIAREQAAGLALRAARWLDRLPSLVDGLERLDLGACRHRLDRLESAARDGEALTGEIREHPCAPEEAARRALSLLEAGHEELGRLRVDLLARSAAHLARAEPPRPAPPMAAVETAVERGWDWLCHNDARRELRNWADLAHATPAAVPDPIRIVLPRGRDLGMLPFSLVLLGFTTAHASLAVGDIALAAPAMLIPMAAFYTLFLVPGVMLFRESVRARRREELTICGSSVMLRWRWALWRGVETVVVAPDEPVRRDEIGRSGEHPIHRLCLEGLDGRKLFFAFGLTDAQHRLIIRQIGRKMAPMLPSRPGIGLPGHGESEGISHADRDHGDHLETGGHLPYF